MRPLPFIIAVFLLLFNAGCDEDSPTNSNIQPGSGLIFVDSNPPGAEIFLQNTSTGKFTPDNIKNLAPDSYDVRLKLNEFTDSSLVANVKAGLQTTVYVDFTLSTGNLFVSSFPQGAQIFLNNINTGKITPDTIFYLEARVYEVKLKFSDGSEVIRLVTIVSGQISNLNVDYFGTLSITSNPSGAEVFLDGVTTGKVTPAMLDSLFPGYYNISLNLAGYNDTTVTVQIHPGYQELFINYVTSTIATVSGVGSLPPGVAGSIGNTRVALYISEADFWADATFAFVACDGTGNYTLSPIVPGTYYMDAWKDNDNSLNWTSGDYLWWNGSGAYPATLTLAPIQFIAGANSKNFQVILIP